MTEIKLLRTIPIFSELSEDALDAILKILIPQSLAAGEVLFHQGEPGDELIIVKEGKIAIFAPLPDQPAAGQPIRIFLPGDMLGEMALIDQKPRSLSARAEEAAVVLKLDSGGFRQILDRNPEMNFSVMRGLSDRIRYTTDFLTEVRQWVQRITEGNYQNAHSVAQSQAESQKHADPTMATLAAEFAQMAARVKEREDTLRQEVIRLQVEIDEAKRKKEVSQIMDSEYYKSLKERVKAMRQQRTSDGEADE